MEYELIKDCHYGNKGKIVDRGVYLRATYEERKTLFREVSTVSSRSAGYNSSYDHHNDSLGWADNDTSSSFSSSPSRDDSFDFGGGSFGGGGASGDYDDSGYGSSDSSSSDSGSSDCGSSSD